ncbi:MAG: GspH/FimT family pseudopilin [Caulobacteraceae bacterium]
MSATGEAGTTLIEALVVVSISAMIGAIVFPELQRGLASAAFAEGVSGVRADLRIARAQALSSGEPVQIEVAADGRSYGWTPGPERGLVGGLSLSPAGPAVLFYPDGSASGGELALSNGRAQARFEVEAATGVLRTEL